MLPVGSIASGFASCVGLLAGTIAVGGFIGHAPSALAREPEEKVRQATVVGGLGGALLGCSVMLLSAIIH
jgi:hypothetical protein